MTESELEVSAVTEFPQWQKYKMLLKQEYWISKSFTLIIYLKIESYIQLKIKNSQRFDVCNASYSCDNRNDKIVTIYFSNKCLISYIKTLSKIKSNPYTTMMYLHNKNIRHIIVCCLL